MRVIVCLILLLLLLLVTAACTGADTPTATPTPTPEITSTPRPSNTPRPTTTDIPTLPPAWTPGVTPTVLRPTDEPTPTFTPTIDPNSTLQAQPARAECAGFGIDLALTPRTFIIGTDPQVHWLPAQDALTYRITLLDDQARSLFVITTGGTSYTFDGRWFEVGRNYTWNVRPLDVNGAQMCVSRGSVLTPVIG